MPFGELTEDEYGEGMIIARKLMKIQGITSFTVICENAAKKRFLSRKQLETLRKALANPGIQNRFRQVKSNRPITLPKVP